MKIQSWSDLMQSNRDAIKSVGETRACFADREPYLFNCNTNETYCYFCVKSLSTLRSLLRTNDMLVACMTSKAFNCSCCGEPMNIPYNAYYDEY